MPRTNEGIAMTSLILETFRLNGALLSAGNRLTKPFDLTSARWQVLGPIADELLTVAQIARRMGLARQGVQRIVNDLVDLGLVTLKPNLDHKRAPLVALTKTGKEIMEEVNTVQAEWVNELTKGFSEQQISEALNLMATVRKRIE